MKYSKLLNLGEILQNAPTHVIMRRSDMFPRYRHGQDVDLLVENMDKMTDHLCRELPDYTRYVINTHHIQIDYWKAPQILDLKFDLYSLHISGVLTGEILRTKEPIMIHGHKYWVPQAMMDNLLKCYEYLVNKKGKYQAYEIYKPLLRQYYERQDS